MGLTGPHSNYKMLSEKVNALKLATPVKSDPDPELTDLSYDPNLTIKTITQQQKHEFSEKEISEIVEKYQTGESTYDLAGQYSCHRSTIAKLLKKRGVEVKVEKIDAAEAIRMYESGSTAKEIANKYHMSDNAVSRRLKKAGVKMRTRWDCANK